MAGSFARAFRVFFNSLVGGVIYLKPRDALSGTFTFLNHSGVEVAWVQVTGFPPPCDPSPGYFPVNCDATAALEPVTCPESCTITWWYRKGEPKHEQIIALRSIPPEQRQNTALFTFTLEKTWQLQFVSQR